MPPRRAFRDRASEAPEAPRARGVCVKRRAPVQTASIASRRASSPRRVLRCARHCGRRLTSSRARRRRHGRGMFRVGEFCCYGYSVTRIGRSEDLERSEYLSRTTTRDWPRRRAWQISETPEASTRAVRPSVLGSEDIFRFEKQSSPIFSSRRGALVHPSVHREDKRTSVGESSACVRGNPKRSASLHPRASSHVA